MRTRSQPMSPNGLVSLETAKQPKRKVSAPSKTSTSPVKSNANGARDSRNNASNEKTTKDTTKRRSRKPSATNKQESKLDSTKEDNAQSIQPSTTEEKQLGTVPETIEEATAATNNLKRSASDDFSVSPPATRKQRTDEDGNAQTNVTPSRPLRRRRVTSGSNSRNITPYAERMRRRKIEKEGRIDKTFFRIPQLVAQNEADREQQELAASGNRHTESEDYSSLKELQHLRDEAKQVSLQQDQENTQNEAEGDENEPRTPPSLKDGESTPSRWQLKDLLTSVPRSISRMMKSPFRRSQTSGVKKSKSTGPQTPQTDSGRAAKTPPSQTLKDIHSLSPAMSSYVSELSRKLPQVKNELEDEIVKQVSEGSIFATPTVDATEFLKPQPVSGSFSSTTDTEDGKAEESFPSHADDPQTSSYDSLPDPPTPPAPDSAVNTKRVRFDNSPMDTPSKLRQQNIPHSPDGSPSFVPNAPGTFDVDQFDGESEEEQSSLHERSPSPQKKPPSPTKTPPPPPKEQQQEQQATGQEEPFIPNPHGTFDIDAILGSSDEENEDEESTLKSPSSPKVNPSEISEATTPPSKTPEGKPPQAVGPALTAGVGSAASSVFADVFSRSQDQKGEESPSRQRSFFPPDSADSAKTVTEDGKLPEYNVAEEDIASGSEFPSPNSPSFGAPPSPQEAPQEQVSTPKQQTGFFGPRAPTPYANPFATTSTPSTEMIKRLRDQAERHKPKTPSGLRVSRRSSTSPKDSPESIKETSDSFPSTADSVPPNPFAGMIKEVEKKGVSSSHAEASAREGKAKNTLFNPFGASAPPSDTEDRPSTPAPASNIFAGLNNKNEREPSSEAQKPFSDLFNKPSKDVPPSNPFFGMAKETEKASAPSSDLSVGATKEADREPTPKEGTQKPLFDLSASSSLFKKDALSPNIFAGSNKETGGKSTTEQTKQTPLFNLSNKPTVNRDASPGAGAKKRAPDGDASKDEAETSFFNPFTADPTPSNALVEFGEGRDQPKSDEGEEAPDDALVSAQLENLPDDLSKFQWPDWTKPKDLSSDPIMQLVKEYWTEEDSEAADALFERQYKDIVAERAEEAAASSNAISS